MIEQFQQRIARGALRALEHASRRVKQWANEHVSEASGGTARGRTGLLERHGVDLSDDDLDQQFAEREEGYLLRRYPSLQAAEGDDGELHTEQVSTSGVDFSDEIPTGEDENTTFQPVKVRGRSGGRGHGLYHQMWLTSSAYQRAWGTPLQGLLTGEWSVEPPDLREASSKQVDEAERRAAKIEKALIDNLTGGWHQFITEWLYALVAGFAPFEKVFHGPASEHAGLIDELSFIYPSAVDGWVMDEDMQRLLGVRFERADNGDQYALEARHLQLYSHLRLGDNFEGVSTLRSITRWIQTVQLLQQLENLSKERLGVPWIAASYDDPLQQAGNDDADDKLMNILEDARAEESPVMKLPNGASMELHSAAGSTPEFEKPKRFAIEQIHSRLNAEGALVGVGQTGAYAAREEASKDALQISGYIAELITRNLNGASNRPYTGVVPQMEEARWGGPVQSGRYCQLEWSPGEIRDPKRVERINDSVKQGTITPDKSVEGAVRKELDLPLAKEHERALQEGPDALDAEGEGASGDASSDEGSSKQEGGEPKQLAAAEDDDDPIEPELDVEKAAKKQDKLEARLARRLKEVAREHKREYRDKVRGLVEDVSDPADVPTRRIRRLERQVRQTMKSQYQEAAREVLESSYDDGAKDLIRSAGETVSQTTSIDVDEQADVILGSEARKVATEAFNRQQGAFEQTRRELARGETRRKLEVLSDESGGAFATVSGKTVSATYNAGRNRVARQVKQSTEEIRGEDVRLIAERSSVLDSDTCEPCEGLDGERVVVGSNRFSEIRPPNKCDGGGRCRCIYSYIFPSERGFQRAVQRLVG